VLLLLILFFLMLPTRARNNIIITKSKWSINTRIFVKLFVKFLKFSPQIFL